MKSKIVVLLLSVVFLASCSSSRYGRIPKAKKKKHTAAVKQFKKNKLNTVELAAIKKTAQNSAIEKAEVVLNKPQSINISKRNATANALTKVTLTTKSASKKVASIKQILKPNKIKQTEKQTSTKDIEKGSWLWYIVVGLVLLLVAALLSGLIGYIFYVAGVVAVVLGLLMLLGLI